MQQGVEWHTHGYILHMIIEGKQVCQWDNKKTSYKWVPNLNQVLTFMGTALYDITVQASLSIYAGNDMH